MVSELLLECKHFLDLVQHGGKRGGTHLFHSFDIFLNSLSIVKKMDENKQSQSN
jgi:hypothetical protein